jgi:hypothetical protein
MKMITLRYSDDKYIPEMICDNPACRTKIECGNAIVQWNDNLRVVITCKNCINNSYNYCVTLESFMFNLCCNIKAGVLKKAKWN